jgi:subtilisin family serine protease
LTFSPSSWSTVQRKLAEQVPMPEAVATFSSGSAVQPPGVSAIPSLGVAFVDPKKIALDEQALGALTGAAVRPEYVLRRPATVAEVELESTAEESPGLVDDREAGWALRAIGLAPRDDDGEGILVGVVDSGVDPTHPDIRHCLHQLTSFVDGAPADGDDMGHGTHVVGIIAGAAKPEEGPRYGLAPRAKVNVYRVFGKPPRDGEEETDEAAVIGAVHRAADDGCRIVVLAAGRDGGTTVDPSDAALGAYVARRGALLIAAAGNESHRPGKVAPTNAPANAFTIFAVGASTPAGDVWTGSNGLARAKAVDAVAPGVNVLSAAAQGRTIRFSGTSVSTAVAAGVAAVIWSRQKDWSAGQVAAELRRLAVRVGGAGAEASGAGQLRVPSRDDSTPRPVVDGPGEVEERRLRMSDEEGRFGGSSAGSLADVFEGIASVLRQQATARLRVLWVDVGGPGVAESPKAPPGEPALGEPGFRVKFNLQGHAVIAILAENILAREEPAKHQILQGIMSAHPLGGDADIGTFAQWPDRIKHPQKDDTDDVKAAASQGLGKATQSQHFVNYACRIGQTEVGTPKAIGKGDILTGLPSWAEKLRTTSDPEERSQALAFVLHLVGDIHQPLHCAALVDRKLFPGDEGDEGGNLIRWGADRPRASNLHAVWDDAIAAKPAEVERRVADLDASFTRDSFVKELKLTAFPQWALESYAIALQVYNDFFDTSGATYVGPSEAQQGGQQFTSPSAEYRAHARDAMRARGALAAFRLADVLKKNLPDTI